MRAALLTIVLAFLSACSRDAPSSVTMLTYASPYAPSHPFSRADLQWIKWIETQSGGRLRIQPYWSGSLLSSEHSLIELRHGIADIGLITPIYARGGAHLQRTQAGFYAGLRTYSEQTRLYRCLAAYDPQFGRELHGLHVLAVQGGNLPGIVTRDRPVRTLVDLKGLRLRAPSELLAVLKDLDADPVDMPMREVYSALAKGVLDGVVAPADTLRSLHFGEVARYFTEMEIPRGAYAARAMGERRWTALEPWQRKLLQRGIAIWEDALASELIAANQAGYAMGREQGVTFFTMPPAERARFETIYVRDGETRARSLTQFDIDGLPTFERALELVPRIAAGETPDCTKEPNEPTP
ncbi:MAG TPA: TRAP transporter substrate-binding protein DctP [Povalibacter sp.]